MKARYETAQLFHSQNARSVLQCMSVYLGGSMLTCAGILRIPTGQLTPFGP